MASEARSTLHTPKPKRRFVLSSGPQSTGRSDQRAEKEDGADFVGRQRKVHTQNGGLARDVTFGDRIRQDEKSRRDAAAASTPAGLWITPMARHFSRSGTSLDAESYEAPVVTRAERAALRREQLMSSQDASRIVVTDGGEGDMDLGGLPPKQFHGSEGWVSVSDESALNNSVLNRSALESRKNFSMFSVAAQTVQHEATRNKMDDIFSANTTLEPLPDAIQNSVSTYTLRKMYLSGLVGYQGVVTVQEEAAICAEVMKLLQSPSAGYVPEECRYVVNLYETEIGVPGKDTLAFAMDLCPKLKEVLFRLYYLGLIPNPPNVCQVSEMTGAFAGYPPHLKHPSIGSYFGLLNFVSSSVMHLKHLDMPWCPKIYTAPRSLFVVEPPCLHEYRIGSSKTHKPFHPFNNANRISHDYRIEILFAAVDVVQKKHMHEAIQLTEYAKQQQQGGSGHLQLGEGSDENTSQGDASTTAVPHQRHPGYGLEKLFKMMNETKDGGSVSGEDMKHLVDVGKAKEMDVGSRSGSMAKNRLAAIKARHARQEARKLSAESSPKRYGNDMSVPVPKYRD